MPADQRVAHRGFSCRKWARRRDGARHAGNGLKRLPRSWPRSASVRIPARVRPCRRGDRPVSRSLCRLQRCGGRCRGRESRARFPVRECVHAVADAPVAAPASALVSLPAWLRAVALAYVQAVASLLGLAGLPSRAAGLRRVVGHDPDPAAASSRRMRSRC